MTKITQQKILEKIQKLEKYLSYLKQIRKETKSEKAFIDDFHLHGLTERYLQLACQVIIDTLNLVIIEEGVEKPESGQEIVSFLFNKGIISENLFSRLEGIVGFRNILVHEYGKIDHKKVYQYLLKRLKDIEFFRNEILNLIKKQEEKNLSDY